ncbi:Fe-S biogenesis protein NfuA [Candidatus Pantoea carbekii]|uniref:Fe-S biogenesis protein NfuA n=1 Tax=Candidatus Pantoea carbekii TaxID=1235990 RepID=UPI0005C63EAB|nr:Fe-S biogenesis protein NfuA [Candidatus Pantoea carbekii]
MIRITDAAQNHFEDLISTQKEGTQIRVFVMNPGTPAAECGVSYCSVDDIELTDTQIKFNKFLVYIDELSLPYLEGAEIDLISDKLGSQLTLKAPNARIPQISQDASLAERVEYMLISKINPQLAQHNGRVSLIDITEEGYAILQFGGACNGCSMIDITLKNGIEKELLAAVPDLKGVLDITEHQHGKHSYY